MKLTEKELFMNLIINEQLVHHRKDIDISSYYEYIDVDGKTLLHYACSYSKCFRLAKKCLELGLDINLQDNNGYSPLILAVQRNFLKVVKELLKYNPNINLQDKYGNTALFYICNGINLPLVKKMIKLGGDIKTINKNGETLLDYAEKIKNYWNHHIIEYLKSL